VKSFDDKGKDVTRERTLQGKGRYKGKDVTRVEGTLGASARRASTVFTVALELSLGQGDYGANCKYLQTC
jgi:hypothetical protein